MWLWMSLLNNSKCQHFTISLLDEGLLVEQVLLVLNFKLSAKILLDAGSKRKDPPTMCVDGLVTSLTTKTLLTYQALVFHYLLEQRPHLWHQMMPPQLI